MKLEDKTFCNLASDLENVKFSLKDIFESLKKAEEYRAGLLSRSPLQVKDRAILIETPVINDKESWGWLGAKHFLIKGAMATVKEVDFYKGKFIFGLKFDDDSWIDQDNVVHKRDKNSLYFFSEQWVLKI